MTKQNDKGAGFCWDLRVCPLSLYCNNIATEGRRYRN
jgi:hypothetical protein